MLIKTFTQYIDKQEIFWNLYLQILFNFPYWNSLHLPYWTESKDVYLTPPSPCLLICIISYSKASMADQTRKKVNPKRTILFEEAASKRCANNLKMASLGWLFDVEEIKCVQSEKSTFMKQTKHLTWLKRYSKCLLIRFANWVQFQH